MEIPPEYGVIIGGSLATLFITLFGWIRDYCRDSAAEGESQKTVVVSLFLGVFGIVTLGITSIIALILCWRHIKKCQNNGFAKIVFGISVLATLPWIAALIFGS